MQLIILIVH